MKGDAIMRYQLNPVVDVLRTKYGSVANTLDEITAVYTRRGWNWQKRLDRIKSLLHNHNNGLSRRELAYVAVLNRGIASRYLRKAKVKNIDQVRRKIDGLTTIIRKYTLAKSRVMPDCYVFREDYDKILAAQGIVPVEFPVYKRLQPGTPIHPAGQFLQSDVQRLRSVLEKKVAIASRASHPAAVNTQKPSGASVKTQARSHATSAEVVAVEKPVSYLRRFVSSLGKLFGAEKYVR